MHYLSYSYNNIILYTMQTIVDVGWCE